MPALVSQKTLSRDHVHFDLLLNRLLVLCLQTHTNGLVSIKRVRDDNIPSYQVTCQDVSQKVDPRGLQHFVLICSVVASQSIAVSVRVCNAPTVCNPNPVCAVSYVQLVSGVNPGRV